MNKKFYSFFTLFTAFYMVATAQSSNTREKPVDLVYPLLDAANSRWFYFNSATRPFGMVNLTLFSLKFV